MFARSKIHRGPAIPINKPSPTSIIADSFALPLPHLRSPHEEHDFRWWKRTKHDVRTVLNRAAHALRRVQKLSRRDQRRARESRYWKVAHRDVQAHDDISEVTRHVYVSSYSRAAKSVRRLPSKFLALTRHPLTEPQYLVVRLKNYYSCDCVVMMLR